MPISRSTNFLAFTFCTAEGGSRDRIPILSCRRDKITKDYDWNRKISDFCTLRCVGERPAELRSNEKRSGRRCVWRMKANKIFQNHRTSRPFGCVFTIRTSVDFASFAAAHIAAKISWSFSDAPRCTVVVTVRQGPVYEVQRTRTGVQTQDLQSGMQPFVLIGVGTLAHLCSRCLRSTATVCFIVIGLHLVATPVRYNHNSRENISTLSEKSYDSNYRK